MFITTSFVNLMLLFVDIRVTSERLKGWPDLRALVYIFATKVFLFHSFAWLQYMLFSSKLIVGNRPQCTIGDGGGGP